MQGNTYKLSGTWMMHTTANTYKADVGSEAAASKTSWLAILQSLQKLRCYSCQGFGHTLKDCPTDRRLVALGEPDGLWRSLHN